MLKRQKGMTLVETAIVLAIAALVMAAVWSASGSVRDKQLAKDGVEAVTETAQRVRALYTAAPSVMNIDDLNALGKQIERKLFPEYVTIDNSTTRNKWGGKVGLRFKAVNNWISGFSVSVLLPSSMAMTARNQACLAMMASLQGSARAGGTSGSISPTSDDPPLPSVANVPVEDLSPDKGPIYVFAQSGVGGSWANVTNAGADTITGYSSGCGGLAFYFAL